MPEGHTIHRLARDQGRDLDGQHIEVSSPQGRHVELAGTLDGQALQSVQAYGKHLFYCWPAAPLLHIHLGLIGRFRRSEPPVQPPRATVQLRLATHAVAWDLVGATTCELLSRDRYQHLLDRLGPDLLATNPDRERAWARLSRQSTPIGAALLDQRTLSGVGNVFRAEALFLNGIHPERPASSLSRSEFDRLWETLTRLLRQGVEDGRIVTVQPSERSRPEDALELVTPEDAFYVYQQARCRRCGGAIRSWQMGPRRAYACEHCQPPTEIRPSPP